MPLLKSLAKYLVRYLIETLLRVFLGLIFINLISILPSYLVLAQNENPDLNFDPLEIGRPYFRVFSDKDGLPQNSVQSITVDKKSYLWVATQDGAAYYNGQHWTAVNMPNQKVSNYIRALYAGSDGSMWFGTYAGVWRLKDKQWTGYTTTNSKLPNNIIHSFWETEINGQATFWIGTNGGLASLDLESMEWGLYDSKNVLPDNRVRVLWGTQKKEGYQLWVGTDAGFCYFQNGEWQKVTVDILGEKGAALPVRCFLGTTLNGKEVFYVGADGEGLIYLEDGKWSVYDAKMGLPNSHIYDLVKTTCLDGTEKLWLATYGGGLVCLENNKWIVYDTKIGLPNNVTSSLFEMKAPDGSHHLWVGTNGGGLYRLEEDQWLSYDIKNGLSDNTVMSLLESTTKNEGKAIWIGTYGGGLSKLENGSWTTFTKDNGLPDNSILALLETKDKTGEQLIWVATEGNGLALLKGGKWTVFTKDKGLPSNAVRTLLEVPEKDGSRSIWIGTTNGVVKLVDDKWITFNTSNGLPENVVVTMTYTIDKNLEPIIWVGTAGGGLAYYQKDKWTTLKMADGLPSDTIYSLQPSKTGNDQFLWVGTTGGVCRLKINNNKFEWLFFSDATTPSLPNNVINQIQIDKRSRVYLFTNKGVARLTPLNNNPDGLLDYSIYTFTTENGLPSNEFNVGASIVDHKGRIWAGTVAGATVFDPAKDSEDRRSKPFYIERMQINGKDSLPPTNQEISLNYNENSLSFEYALLSYFRESDTRYRVQLVGLDETPSDWTIDYKKEYTTLPEGEYIFKLWAKDYHNNISGPLEVKFYIKSPPWRSWWAYISYIVLLSILVYLVIQLRLKRLEQRNAMLTTLYQKEQEVSRTLQSLSKMKTDFMLVTSHEMRTPLTVLKGYLDSLTELKSTNLTPSQTRMIKTCLRVTDRLIDGVNNIQEMLKIEERRVILKAETVDLKQLAQEVVDEVANFIEQRQQKLIVELDKELPLIIADYEKLQLVLLNLVQNAIKFTHDAGEIKLIVEKDKDRIHIKVIDNGIGIEAIELERIFEKFYTASDIMNHSSGKYGFDTRGTGLGLAVARGYVESHGGKIWAESSGRGKGSCFYIWLPTSNICPLPRETGENLMIGKSSTK